jgi:hypothetical protein
VRAWSINTLLYLMKVNELMYCNLNLTYSIDHSRKGWVRR